MTAIEGSSDQAAPIDSAAVAKRLLAGSTNAAAGGSPSLGGSAGANKIRRFDSATYFSEEAKGEAKSVSDTPADSDDGETSSAPVSSGAVAKRLLKGGESSQIRRFDSATFFSGEGREGQGVTEEKKDDETTENAAVAPAAPAVPAGTPVSPGSVAKRLLKGPSVGGGKPNSRVKRWDSATYFSGQESGGDGGEAAEGGKTSAANATDGGVAAHGSTAEQIGPAVRPVAVVAHVGDSRAVLVRLNSTRALQGLATGQRVAGRRSSRTEGPTVEELTIDHHPKRADEKARIEAAGGAIRNGRLEGCLAVSRAFGDIEYKALKEESWEREFKDDLISAHPEVSLSGRLVC